MRPVLLVPGIGNSGPAHWQSLWEAAHPGVIRVQQRDWDNPVCEDWVAALDQAVAEATQPPILVAHSLGCLAVAHWCARATRQVHAVLLVAVPDPSGPNFPANALGFDVVPLSLGGRQVTMVSSTDDPYSSDRYARERAHAWNAKHITLGPLGHLNGNSGLGAWPEGWSLVSLWRESSPITHESPT